MRKILILVSLFIAIQNLFAQKANVDSVIHAISVSKNDSVKIALIVSLFTPEANNNSDYVIDIGLKLLKQAEADKNSIEESSAYSFFGQGYRLLGNNVKALSYHQKAIALAEQINNPSLLSLVENQMAHIYKDRNESEKAIQLYRSAAAHGQQGDAKFFEAAAYSNLGYVYLSTNSLDSSMMFSQKAYEFYRHSTNEAVLQTALPFVFGNMANVQSKLGNSQLAIGYYNMALANCSPSSAKYLNIIYTGLAQHYQSQHQKDSSEYYARKAIAIVTNSPLFYLSSAPAQLLSTMYENNNCDSTLKYAKIFKTANDSLFNNKTNQQIQLMTFDEDLRQQQLAQEKIKTDEQRHQNIQFALIAFGIISFIVIFLLFSRSIVANEKLISFFGILGLLVVFEFVNLLLHPWLASFTHESPVLMLLALVAIASLLIPFHHKMEHWIKEKMVEKNKAIRLAAAKKTIEKLSDNTNQKI
jgi:tetratricopeptide (TPR) repeat protein